MLRAPRELGLPTSILEAQEQEDSVMMTMIIGQDPEGAPCEAAGVRRARPTPLRARGEGGA
eukprot:4991979-Pyramimonas_sp.AAC.1